MIVELVTFNAPAGADWDAILTDARATIPRWRANKALSRKHYVLSHDGRQCGGLYIWPDRAAAEAAHDATSRAAVKARTGAEPVIVTYDLMMLLDNESETVTEWTADGQVRVRASDTEAGAA